MKTVDILLPTYNGGKFLQEQIVSILEQSHTNFKLLIRDDGSTDDTIEIINSFRIKDERIFFYEDSIGNLGLVSNIEHLLEKSSSEYVMYCDQDDFWLPYKIERLLNEILINEEKFGKDHPLLIHSDAYVTDQQLNITKKFKGQAPLSYGLNKSLFRFYVQGASTIFNCALKVELLPFSKGIYLHDRYTHLIAEIVGNRFYIEEPLMLYRQHMANLVGSTSLWDKVKNNILRDQRFYLKKDRDLIYCLAKRYPENTLLSIYIQITDSSHLNRFDKLVLLNKHKISLRVKEWFLFIAKG